MAAARCRAISRACVSGIRSTALSCSGWTTLASSAPGVTHCPSSSGSSDSTPRSIERTRSEEHTSELQSPCNLVCRLLLEKKKKYMRGACSLVTRLLPSSASERPRGRTLTNRHPTTPLSHLQPERHPLHEQRPVEASFCGV